MTVGRPCVKEAWLQRGGRHTQRRACLLLAQLRKLRHCRRAAARVFDSARSSHARQTQPCCSPRRAAPNKSAIQQLGRAIHAECITHLNLIHGVLAEGLIGRLLQTSESDLTAHIDGSSETGSCVHHRSLAALSPQERAIGGQIAAMLTWQKVACAMRGGRAGRTARRLGDMPGGRIAGYP